MKGRKVVGKGIGTVVGCIEERERERRNSKRGKIKSRRLDRERDNQSSLTLSIFASKTTRFTINNTLFYDHIIIDIFAVLSYSI